jgi:hypothetical protein
MSSRSQIVRGRERKKKRGSRRRRGKEEEEEEMEEESILGSSASPQIPPQPVSGQGGASFKT